MIQTFLSIRLEREEGREEGNGRGGRCTYWGAILCVGGTQQETSLVLNLK